MSRQLSHICMSTHAWTVPHVDESRTFPHINKSHCQLAFASYDESWTVPHINESRTLPHINKSHCQSAFASYDESWTVSHINMWRDCIHQTRARSKEVVKRIMWEKDEDALWCGVRDAFSYEFVTIYIRRAHVQKTCKANHVWTRWWRIVMWGSWRILIWVCDVFTCEVRDAFSCGVRDALWCGVRDRFSYGVCDALWCGVCDAFSRGVRDALWCGVRGVRDCSLWLTH